MGGAHKEIHIQGRHIDGFVREALTGIHKHQGANSMRLRNDHLERITAAKGIADMHKAHQPGARAELGPEIVQIQFAGLGDADVAKHASGALRQLLPGHQVAVMLHHREQHLIAFAQVGISPGAGHEVDRLGGIAGKHNFAGTGSTDEISCDPSGSLERFRRPGTELVGTTVHVGVIQAVIVLKRLKHLTGLLTGRRVIQVDQRSVIR